MPEQPEVSSTGPAVSGDHDGGDRAVGIELEVNGEQHHLEVPARMTLADALRDRLELTGTHLGCEHGVCGACAVLLDGRSVRACITLAAQAHGRRVTTIEGLSPPCGLSPLQQAFSERGGLQCGFCTPGFVVAATELLRDVPAPDEPTVRSALSGNLCRCTGYEAIVDAVLSQADPAARSAAPAWPDDVTGPTRGPGAPPVPQAAPVAAVEPPVLADADAHAGSRRTLAQRIVLVLALVATASLVWRRTRRS